MSKFFVGQRVRIVHSRGWPELAGQEGRVVGVVAPDEENPRGELEVAPDCWGGSVAPTPSQFNGGFVFAPNSDQLEPITPDGAQPSEYTTLHDLLTSLEGVEA